MKRVSWKQLPRGLDRAIARIAHVANVNTILGGASALIMAKRAESMDLPNASALHDAVADVYSASLGYVPDHLAVWECPECGQCRLGNEAASQCCAPCDDWENDMDDADTSHDGILA